MTEAQVTRTEPAVDGWFQRRGSINDLRIPRPVDKKALFHEVDDGRQVTLIECSDGAVFTCEDIWRAPGWYS